MRAAGLAELGGTRMLGVRSMLCLLGGGGRGEGEEALGQTVRRKGWATPKQWARALVTLSFTRVVAGARGIRYGQCCDRAPWIGCDEGQERERRVKSTEGTPSDARERGPAKVPSPKLPKEATQSASSMRLERRPRGLMRR